MALLPRPGLASSNPLHQFKVLLADADAELAKVLKMMLARMGIINVVHTRSGEKAFELLHHTPFDFIITEWNLKDMSASTLITQIRRDAAAPNPTVPIIMLTGQAEQSDVIRARDLGVNEYLVKPFSAKSIYNRLERIVECPRYFVVGKHFIGPDRRSRSAVGAAPDERRTASLMPQRRPQDAGRQVVQGSTKLWLPDFSLKHKLGSQLSLEMLITPALLQQAQASIDAIVEDSMQWIKHDMAELRATFDLMTREQAIDYGMLAKLSDLALTLSTRSGTFGYAGAGKVAYLLYLFCRHQLEYRGHVSLEVIAKHLDVLRLIFSSDLRGEGDDMAGIIDVLQQLTAKYTARH